MNVLKMLLRQLKTVSLAAACWLAAWSTALAQEAEPKGGDLGSWVLSYCLVFLGIGMGVAMVCRSARRRDRPRQETEIKSQIDPS